MFFIVNHENFIIAADGVFLEKVGADSVYNAALLIQNGDIKIDDLEQSVIYSQQTSSFSKYPLTTFMGDAYLYELHEERPEDHEDKDKDAAENDLLNLAVLETESIENDLDIADDLNRIEKPPIETEDDMTINLMDLKNDKVEEDGLAVPLTDETDENDEKTNFPEIDTLKETEYDDIITLAEENGLADSDHKPDTDDQRGEDDSSTAEIIGLVGAGAAIGKMLDSDDDTSSENNFDLKISEEPLLSLDDDNKELENLQYDTSESLLDIEKQDEVSEEDHFNSDLEPKESASDHLADEADEIENFKSINHININIKEVSELIGVTESEYINFLEEFRAEAVRLEPDLRSNDLMRSREAITGLKEASLLLHLPQITEKLNELSDAPSDEKTIITNDLFSLISQTDIGSNDEEVIELASVADMEHDTPIVENEEIVEKKQESIDEIPSVARTLLDTDDVTGSTNTNLDNVKPIPFDFSINEASDDLSLPASLVSEFIVDFINQAKENLPVLQKAYEDEDLSTLQDTAHMLKGASSNLRITAMADTLYSLQFNDDLKKVPELIKRFTGQLKSLSIQMDQE